MFKSNSVVTRNFGANPRPLFSTTISTKAGEEPMYFLKNLWFKVYVQVSYLKIFFTKIGCALAISLPKFI